MRFFFAIFFNVFSFYCNAQTPNFVIKNISLPSEISYYDNQFSGLYIQQNKLFLMSESRLQDNAEAKLYAINLTDIDRKIIDTSFILPYKKYKINNLQPLRKLMLDHGDDYEGLEAIVIENNDVYLTVETATPSNNCYLLKGVLTDTAVEMDLKVLIPLPKPIANDGSHIYNAGFEAMTMIDKTLFTFFEYNSFPKDNLVIGTKIMSYSNVFFQLPTITILPFRITDITKTSKNNYTAINYFFKGGGDDAIYRVPKSDTQNDKLIRDTAGYKSYCRLVNISYKKGKYIWKPLWEFPVQYMSYNWEGIAAYKNGYFLMNDKYTPARPYKSTLLFLAPPN
ncbi:MAG: hypothetical protein ABL929_03495 [Ferruginibacter sp.]